MKRFAALMIALFIFCGVACADHTEWVLIKEYDWVNVRFAPHKNSTPIGRVYVGDSIETDCVKEGHWTHVINFPGEADEGWIYDGYLTTSPVVVETQRYTVNTNRVFLRKNITGSGIKRYKKGEEVTVIAHSIGWALTKNGYIQMQYLNPIGEPEKKEEEW